MSVPHDSFERYKQKGLEALKAGQFDAARVYLLEAARALTVIARSEQSETLRQAYESSAGKLLELAKECQRKAASPAPRRSGPSSPASAEGGGAEAAPHGADDYIVHEKPDVRFDDIAGLEDVKQEIRLRMIYPFEHTELAAKFGIRAGGGVLLYGPPGTGKTLLARATAGELDATFFTVSAADVLSKWVGEAEQNVRRLFDAAVREPRAVIFIDEIESLVPARRDEGSSVMQRVVPQILQGMEGFAKRKDSAVLFMGATNVPWQLDPAVLRPGRFDEKVYVPLPDLEARRKMLEMYLAKRPLSTDVDLDALAVRLDGYSGADIRHFADEAASIPFLRAVAGASVESITPAVIDDVLRTVRPSVQPGALERFEQWTRTASA